MDITKEILTEGLYNSFLFGVLITSIFGLYAQFSRDMFLRHGWMILVLILGTAIHFYSLKKWYNNLIKNEKI